MCLLMLGMSAVVLRVVFDSLWSINNQISATLRAEWMTHYVSMFSFNRIILAGEHSSCTVFSWRKRVSGVNREKWLRQVSKQLAITTLWVVSLCWCHGTPMYLEAEKHLPYSIDFTVLTAVAHFPILYLHLNKENRSPSGIHTKK